MADIIQINETATLAYIHFHGKTAFNSVNMIDYLLVCLDVPLEQCDALAASGTCSALAINVSLALMDAEPDKYDFKMYDCGDHKICRCLMTFTIIGSSSEHGAIIKPPGET
ncbi:hypothetical protein FNAPI_10820 [Fusarium napiforme]|uniref:Uncharacterized protein n=1 Tax=Fusarium napiforme TaxID=42672 RepID=A0A8H5IM79_9HYPO|nr:hypothetical protein FNAPI_10820 [Fusarium napiforme]